MHKTALAVLISDTHYSLSTYQIADQAWRQAVDKAYELRVPLIDAGDLTNDKAIMRAEVMNTLIKTMEYAQDKDVEVYCLIGNHSLINEKGSEHALNFLKPYCNVIDKVCQGPGVYFIPYQSKADKFLDALAIIPNGSIVIAHQGTKGGVMGDYIQDHSAFDPGVAEGYKIYCGHYHQHYTLGSTVSIGNPYTLSFGEVNDPPKGFLILYSDGSFERVLTNLRRHVVITAHVDELPYPDLLQYSSGGYPKYQDLIWIKVRGPRSDLDKLDKVALGNHLFGHSDFKLDKIYTENEIQIEPTVKPLTAPEAFDFIIDQTHESEAQKEYIKQLYRELLCGELLK